MKMTNRIIIQVRDHEIPAGTLMFVEDDQQTKALVAYNLDSVKHTRWLSKSILSPLPPEPQLPSLFLYNFSDQERARLLTDAYLIRFIVSREAWEDVVLPELGDGDPFAGWVIDSPPYTIGIQRPIPLIESSEGYLSVMLSIRYSSTLNES